MTTTDPTVPATAATAIPTLDAAIRADLDAAVNQLSEGESCWAKMTVCRWTTLQRVLAQGGIRSTGSCSVSALRLLSVQAILKLRDFISLWFFTNLIYPNRAHNICLALTPEFKRQTRKLEKRYRQLRSDLQPMLTQIQTGEIIGDRLQGISAEVFKIRVRNSDVNRGKSGGYRVIYWLKLPDVVVLLDIYSKSDRDDVEISTIQNIISEFEKQIDDETL